MTLTLRPRGSERLKIAAIALLLVPIAILLLFAIGETAGGDWSGLQHVPEAAVLLVLLAAAWRYPYVTGLVLMAAGVALFAGWLVFALANLSASAIVVAALMLFAPPIVAGWLLYRAGQ